MIKKFLAVFLLLLVIENILQPTITYALTVGPIQPEYTSYEQPGATDMVNLMTGDFTFSLPILEVPGPEGSFPLPLTYNAGIGLDQEASWVGLGWTMNAGAITRTITGFPDDANGEAQSITVQNLTGMHGWDASFNVIVASGMFGWNSLEGSYGSLGVLGLLNGQWSSNGWSAGVIGVNVFGTDPNFNGAQFATGLITIATMGLGYEASIRLPTAQIQTAKKAVDALGTASMITGFAQSLASGLTSPNAPSDGYFPYSKEQSGFNMGIFSYTQYKIWLDQTRVEEMYGMMYLGNAPTQTYSDPSGSPVGLNLKIGSSTRTLKSFKRTAGTSNQGAASDINYMPSSNPNLEFYQVNNPALLAPDHFGVKAPGITGNIQPYRLEIGSVAMPREMTANHDRLAPVTFMTNDASYKVPFVYRGQLSNRYYHHVGSSTLSAGIVPSMNTINYGINTLTNTPTAPSITFDLNDVIFETTRTNPSIPINNKIPQANYVEWLTNDEIRNGITYPSKFIDFLSGGSGSSVYTTSDRYLFRTKNAGNGLNTTSTTTYFNSTAIPVPASFINNLTPPATVDLYFTFYNDQASHDAGIGGIDLPLTGQTVNAINTGNNTFSIGTVLTSYTGKYADIQIVETNASVIPTGFGSPNAIGGFCITGSNGVTYHFALPIYDYNQYSEVRDVSDPANKKTVIRRNPAFANTWTLTGITGPDFIDRGGPGNAANGIIDDNDWGYWVKFNYGLQTNQYQWRTPYGTGFRQEYQVPGAPTFESYSQGNSQLIYLNSIETRSHVALFLKGQRADGKGQNGVLPMRLEEIALVTKETYNQMVTSGLPQFSNNISNLGLSSLGTAARAMLNANCTKRILFNYNYSLCNLVPNSSSGKLTLSSVSILGRNSVKTLPDYKFEYANNPNYDANLWDGWGAYNNSNGAISSSQHDTFQPLADVNGAAWSLTKITNPIGSEININYERDTYSTISGASIDALRFDFNNPGATYRYPTDFPLRTISVSNQLNVGDRVRLAANVAYTCYNGSTGAVKSSGTSNINTDFRVAAVGPNSVTFDGDFFSGCGSNSSGDYVTFSSFAGSVYKYYDNKKGDGIRVASITTKNEFGAQKKIRYLYTSGGISSGVVAQEPIFIGTPSEIPGYPYTPVIYGQVTVLNGNLTTDGDYYSSEVYQFETPDASHYKLTQREVNGGELALTAGNTLTSFENKVEDRSAKIGSLKSVTAYGNSSIQSSQIIYTDQLLNGGANNYQGIYTSGVLMFDRISIPQGPLMPPMKKHKTNRTTVIQYPYITYKVINTNDGFSTENTNLSWDLITGATDQTLQKSNLGLYVKNVNVPAYRVYSELSSKAYDPNNRNMLSQSAASYSYKSNMNANEISLISGSVQNWRKDWSNYRYYDGSSAYTESPQEAINTTNPIWRKGPSYVWKGSFAKLISDKVNDGTFTFSPLVDLFPSSASDPLWQYTGEITRFDHYGMALESKNLNNIYSSTKLGYDNRIVVAQASNANYNEMAFSSAEDEIAGIGYFGGEVAKGSGTVVKKSQGSDAHTGDCSLSLSSGYGFVFEPSNLTSSRTYRISAWANSTNGRLYYKSGGSDVLSAAPSQQGKAGWYLMTLEIPANTSFTEVGVKSASGTVLFDDFRFQPKDAAMTCNVYYPLDYQYTAGAPSIYYTLGNDNLYTKYETSEDGKSNRVYMESIKYGGEKLVSEKKSNLRRFNTNQ